MTYSDRIEEFRTVARKARADGAHKIADRADAQADRIEKLLAE